MRSSNVIVALPRRLESVYSWFCWTYNLLLFLVWCQQQRYTAFAASVGCMCANEQHTGTEIDGEQYSTNSTMNEYTAFWKSCDRLAEDAWVSTECRSERRRQEFIPQSVHNQGNRNENGEKNATVRHMKLVYVFCALDGSGNRENTHTHIYVNISAQHPFYFTEEVNETSD